MENPTIEELVEILESSGGLSIESDDMYMECHEGGYYLGSSESDGYVTDDNRSHTTSKRAVQYMIEQIGGLDKILEYDEA